MKEVVNHCGDVICDVITVKRGDVGVPIIFTFCELTGTAVVFLGAVPSFVCYGQCITVRLMY